MEYESEYEYEKSFITSGPEVVPVQLKYCGLHTQYLYSCHNYFIFGEIIIIFDIVQLAIL